MTFTRWWLRIVGIFYVFQFVMVALVKASIAAQGPPGTLERAAQGDPLARFVVDTWVIFGLEILAIGIALLLAARAAERARALIVAIIAIELCRGIIADIYILLRGGPVVVAVPWLVIHSVVIVTGALALRATERGVSAEAASLARHG